MFKYVCLSPIIVLFPKSTWPYLSFWKHFVAVWDHLFKVDPPSLSIWNLPHQSPLTTYSYFNCFCMLQTSNTVSWSLYHMALEQEIQEKLYQEVISVCPGDKVPTSDDIARIPWLKTVVRETLRMYPVVPGNARINVENEIVVGDHIFPKNVSFTFC
uniref:Cytochrome P450 n=1 Tax=Oncorhynchus mykiss TaxID=8022 RepID=A0A8C7NTZ3_ONCMY